MMTGRFRAAPTLTNPSRENSVAFVVTGENSAADLRKSKQPIAAATIRTNPADTMGEPASLLALRSRNEAILITTRANEMAKIVDVAEHRHNWSDATSCGD